MSNTVPQGWRLQAIDEFAKTSAGGTPSTQEPEYWDNGIIPWMSSGEVHKKRVKNVAQKITELGFQNSSAKLFPKGTILVALAGQGKTRGTVAISEIELTTNQSIAGVIIKDKTVSPDYVYQNLDSRYEELRAVSGGSGRAGLNLAIIGEQQLMLPPLTEQKKIAAILSSIDKVIEKTRAQVDKLKDLKTGMMQELLTKGIGHAEFKDSPVGRIPAEWSVVSLEQICDPDSPITYGVLKPGSFVAGGQPLLQIRDLDSGTISPENLHRIGNDLDYEYRRSRVIPGDIIISLVGTIGRTAIIPGWMTEANIHRNLGRIRTENNKLVYHFLQSPMALEQLGLSSSGSSQSALNLSALRQMLLPLPPKEETEQITKCLDSVDQRLSMVLRKYSRLLMNKKALMQDLLTGKVRVQVDIRELTDA